MKFEERFMENGKIIGLSVVMNLKTFVYHEFQTNLYN